MKSASALSRAAQLCLIGQGLYFAVTGAWPLVHMQSFLAVTGPKRDLWLVQTVGALIVVIGLALLAAGFRRVLSLEGWILATGSALALLLVDVIFTAERIISPVYLLDALPEAALLVFWVSVAAHVLRRAGGGLHPPRPWHLATQQ